MIQIKSKDGLTIRCEIKSFSYNGAFMSDRSITITYKSPEIIPFAIGDYVEYRGEKFVLDYDPSDSKEAEVRRSGDAITYNLTFHPESHVELQNCDFCDYVLYDNQLHYSSSPKFSFIGTAHDLADRIKANLDRLYPGQWTIKIDPSVVTEDKNIEIENTSCWNAVVLFNKEYGLNFTVSNRTVKVGFPPVVVKHTFNYGINNGLYKIERNVNSDEAVITRLKAYGSDRNIPKDYNKLSTDIVPKKNLMLPGYKETGIDYIDSDNISIYGIRPQSVVFDDIYPSIEGVEVDGIGRIDEIVSAEQVTADTEAKGTFTIKIKDIGFDINNYLVSGETATISIKNGSLLGYEFEIVKVEKLDTGGYELTLNKSKRDNWQVPNKDQNLQSGNRFVLLHIRMPEKYVTYAEEKLLKRAKEFLARYDHVTYTYNIGVDEIFMARNISLYEGIMEGDKLPIYDADLLIDYDIIIQSLVITEGDGIPLYKISLSDQPVSGTIDKIWDAINNIKNQGSVSNSMISGGGGTSPEELNRKYLRKDVDDTAKGNIYLERNIGSSIYLDGWEGKGWRIENSGLGEFDAFRVRSDIFLGGKVGSPYFASGFTGWGWEIDSATASGTVDNWTVRKTFKAYEMVYSQVYGLNSSFLVSDWNKIKSVTPLGSDRYRCKIDDMTGEMFLNLRVGDYVRTQKRDGVNIRYLVSLVESISGDTFDLRVIEGDGAPLTGDYVQRIGNKTDKNRQGLIYFTSSDDYAPYIDILDGVTSAHFTQDNTKVRIGNLRELTINGKPLDMYGIYINGGIFQHSTYYLDDGTTIEQQFTIMDGKLNSSIEEIRKDLSEQSGNILKNSSFAANLNYWNIDPLVRFISVEGGYLWVPSSFYTDKERSADIYQDGARNVLRILNSTISQPNGVMNIPEHEGEDDQRTYSFAFYYKVLRPGTCEVGIPDTELYITQELTASDEYLQISKVGKWNGKGDFVLRFTGEVLIYGLAMFADEMADAVIRLETQIQQTSEYIKLLATKEYVDAESGKIYTKYDASLTVMAEEIAARVSRKDFDTETGAIRQEIASGLSIQAGSIQAVSTKVDNINHTIETAGWINSTQGNALYAAKTLENGQNIISYINQTPGSTTINSNRINLVGAVSFSMLSDYTTVNNKINGKADASSLGDLAWQDQITKGMMSVALQSELNGKVSTSALGSLAYASSISKNDLASSLLTEFNGKANSASLKALAYLDKVETAQLGSTLISGGHIVTSLIDTDSIYANQAYIGNFSIENGWFKSNSTTGENVGYIDMRSPNTRAAFGTNLIPSTAGGAFTCTGIISNRQANTGDGAFGLENENIALSLEAKNADANFALDCLGGVRKIGRSVDINEPYIHSNTAAVDVIEVKMRYYNFFNFQPASNTISIVRLPSANIINSTFKTSMPGGSPVSLGMFEITVAVQNGFAGRIVLVGVSNGRLIQNNGEILNDYNVSGYNYGTLSLTKGNIVRLVHFNGYWTPLFISR